MDDLIDRYDDESGIFDTNFDESIDKQHSRPVLRWLICIISEKEITKSKKQASCNNPFLMMREGAALTAQESAWLDDLTTTIYNKKPKLLSRQPGPPTSRDQTQPGFCFIAICSPPFCTIACSTRCTSILSAPVLSLPPLVACRRACCRTCRIDPCREFALRYSHWLRIDDSFSDIQGIARLAPGSRPQSSAPRTFTDPPSAAEGLTWLISESTASLASYLSTYICILINIFYSSDVGSKRRTLTPVSRAPWSKAVGPPLRRDGPFGPE